MLGLYLKELTLNNYRNYIKLELNFNSNLIVFMGKNAQGKTNILESIYLSCTGRSHRTPKDRELIRWGENHSYIRTIVEKTEGSNYIEILIHNKQKKKIKINGIEAQRLGELMGHLNGVIFSPEDLKLIKEGPVERRRFMDMEISQVKPKYFYYLQRYNKVLFQRNNLLKDIQKNPGLKKTLPVWDEQIAETGSYITYTRIQFVRKLADISREIHKKLSFGTEELQVVYKSSIPFKNEELNEIQENFLSILQQNQTSDIERGSTLYGCHRDDIILMVNGFDVRTYGSQGQQRTVALSLKLSELELMYQESGEFPILLLDDVMSELDPYRQRMLLEYLNKVQTFITVTDLTSVSISNSIDMEIYKIEQGEAELYSR